MSPIKIAFLSSYVLFLIAHVSSCVDFKCYANFDYAKQQSEKFCSVADANKEQCESMVVAGKGICVFQDSVCKSSRQGLAVFVRIPAYECGELKSEESCRGSESCRWDFSDPVSKYHGGGGTYNDWQKQGGHF